MSNFYGLIGLKLGHSFSPKLHSLILKNTNSNAVYNLFELKQSDLKTSIDGLKALGCMGVNVTIPYKVDVIQYLDKLSHEAEKIGAVNTISFNNGILTGYNTDYNGFGASLKKANVNIENKNAVILGTGGASKAVVQYLMDNNINDIIFVSRTPKTHCNISNLKIISYSEIEKLKNQDLIINCTPCGMYPDMYNCPVDTHILSKFSTAIDLIYNPSETVFLQQAKQMGLRAVNGLYMLVAQAVASQEIWRGIKIPNELADEIYDEIKIN
ncbi:shikimate dehydrogenase [Clostridiaceae bacterium UIB06]|uniref:Shikimate dehydrogenase (NADP(+)) n=1 Tax=Clostridium thailandense TaxID=2794346 RepID=A0A949TV10_9CLOT|nr:shikimate dehydrogenase [Clostridium thailandense]MBV7272933.1 shikimate dehydrogenase [Clostridium thailandense]MCH5136256.1 shikimate dehydrogenase [Clostridiaceae bacterium UIB06]